MGKQVGLILIATGKYDVFLPQLLEGINEHFFINENIGVYLFSDKEYEGRISSRINLHRFDVPHLKFPFPTLYRYKWITEHSDSLNSDHLFYCDVDMCFVGRVDAEILCDGLTVTQHPGFYKGGWGSKKTKGESMAYVPPEQQNNYVCGGFQGGSHDEYLKAAKILSENIETDLKMARSMFYIGNSGVLAEWHDESHWNWYIKQYEGNIKILSPSYCYPMLWDLPFEKKILALDKDHKEIRS